MEGRIKSFDFQNDHKIVRALNSVHCTCQDPLIFIKVYPCINSDYIVRKWDLGGVNQMFPLVGF